MLECRPPSSPSLSLSHTASPHTICGPARPCPARLQQCFVSSSRAAHSFVALFVCKQKASFLSATPYYFAVLERREGWRGRLVVSGELGVISNSLPATALSGFPPFVIFVSKEGFSFTFSLTGLVSHSLGPLLGILFGRAHI